VARAADRPVVVAARRRPGPALAHAG
jgi:hypothetical protein